MRKNSMKVLSSTSLYYDVKGLQKPKCRPKTESTIQCWTN